MIPIRFRLILKRHYFHLPRAGIVHYRSRPFASVRPSAERHLGICFFLPGGIPSAEKSPPADADMSGNLIQRKPVRAHFFRLTDGDVVFGDGRWPATAFLWIFGTLVRTRAARGWASGLSRVLREGTIRGSRAVRGCRAVRSGRFWVLMGTVLDDNFVAQNRPFWHLDNYTLSQCHLKHQNSLSYILPRKEIRRQDLIHEHQPVLPHNM